MTSGLFLAMWLVLLSPSAQAASPVDYNDPAQVQPYIESLKRKHKIPEKKTELSVPQTVDEPARVQTPPEGASYSDPQRVQPYIEELRAKAGLGPSEVRPASGPESVQPYIESVKKGHQLEPKYSKNVRRAAGFNIVASNRFDISSKLNEAVAFERVYNTKGKYSLGFDVFYEYQFFRNPYFGSVGAVGRLGFLMASGNGVFVRTGEVATNTAFRFMVVPASAGVGYRLTQGKLLVPFVQALGSAIPFWETRDDDLPTKQGWSRGMNLIGGVAINLDWISRRDAWSQYENNGILHSYLVVQAEFLRTLAGPVKFDYDGFYGGFLFEF